jgi:hypothetical protein
MKTTKSNAAVLKKDAAKETKKVGPVSKSQWEYKKSLLYKKGGSTMKYQTKGTVDTKKTDNNKQTMKPSSYIMDQFKKGLMKKANAKKINPATGGMDYTSGDTTTNQRFMERKKGGSTKLAKLAPPYDKVTRADVLKGRGVFKKGGSVKKK